MLPNSYCYNIVFQVQNFMGFLVGIWPTQIHLHQYINDYNNKQTQLRATVDRLERLISIDD